MRTSLLLAGTILASSISLGALGCGSGDPGDSQPEKLRDDIPDPVEGGVQLISPTFTVAPGEEVFVCMKYDLSPTEKWHIGDSRIYQSSNGHHVMLYYVEGSSAGVDPAPHRCDGLDMTNVRIVTTGSANGFGILMPEGVVMDVPEGVEIWSQSHYINATDEERLVQDVVNLELVAEEDVTDVAGGFTHLDLTFAIPAGQEMTTELECVMTQDMTVPWIIPHMHEWGTQYDIKFERGGEQLFHIEGAWTAALRNDFPIELFEEPMQIKAGDILRTTCTWNNTENTPLLFPQEMCVTFFPYYPSDGTLLACDETGNVFTP